MPAIPTASRPRSSSSWASTWRSLKRSDSPIPTARRWWSSPRTGGLTILDGDLETGHVLAVYNSDDHTPTVVPVFAYGPGSREFTGTYINIEIPRTIKRLVTK